MRYLLTLLSATTLAMGPQTASPPAQTSAPPNVIGAAPAAQVVPPPPNYQYPNGRSYVYAVEWHLLNAGTAIVKMEAAGAEQKVSAIADSSGVVNVLYAVHDRFEARFDPHTFCSLRVTKHTEEGPHKRDTDIHFDYARRKSLLDEKNLKTGETKHTENDIPSCVTDVVTGFYYLASLPLQTGNAYHFVVNDGGKTTEAVAHVEAHEQVKTPAGTFPTVRVTAEAITGPLAGKGKIWVWYTDDPNHTPVQMRAKLRWGTLLFRMQRLEQAAH
jgi:hypothetical protein